MSYIKVGEELLLEAGDYTIESIDTLAEETKRMKKSTEKEKRLYFKN
jgi:hypothetical protein